MQAGERDKLLPGEDRSSACDRHFAAQERPRDEPLKWRIPPQLALVILGCLLVGCSLLSFVTVAHRQTPIDASTKVNEDQELDPQEGDLPRHDSVRHATGGTYDESGNIGMGETVESGQSGTRSRSDKPNVIFIMAEDMGMNDIGLKSSDLAEVTPFMNSLINDGVHLSRYYTNHICTPARASLMSGRDTFLTGMQFGELENSMPWGLPLDETTLAERFKAVGYATHMVGKWGLGMFMDAYYPFNRGFDTFLGYLGPLETYYDHNWTETHLWKDNSGYYDSKDYGYGDKDGFINSETNTTRWGPELKGVYSTSLTANRAVQVASEHQASREARDTDSPLFLYLAFQLEVLSRISSEATERMMFAKILYFLDITLERMVGELDALGMMDNTLLVFASDNGGCPTYGGNNFPYRGFKHTLFEGGVRTPAFVYSKSESIVPLEARGTMYDDVMHVTDWTQTLANVTGIPTGEMGKPLSGYDHWSAIIGLSPESALPVRKGLVLGRSSYEFNSTSSQIVPLSTPRGAYIYDGWKINIGDKCTGWFSFNPTENILYDPFCSVGECATCDNGCVYEPATNDIFLFDLNNDPYERVNLFKTMPEKFDEINALFNAATIDEVIPQFKGEDPRSQENGWSTTAGWLRGYEAAHLAARLFPSASTEIVILCHKEFRFPACAGCGDVNTNCGQSTAGNCRSQKLKSWTHTPLGYTTPHKPKGIPLVLYSEGYAWA